MQCLRIGINKHSEDVVQYIANELQNLKNKKINFSIDENDYGDSTSIVLCSVDEEKGAGKKSDKSYDALRMHVANALADYIIRKYEDKIVEKIINTNYCYFNSVEKKEILTKAYKIIRNEDKNFLNSLFQIRRRNIIIKKLLEYFEASDTMVLDGFVNFRLKDYRKDLEELVDKAVDEFLMEREYKEFIRLLRYFVEIQEPRFSVIHVLNTFDNKYILMDEKKQEITNECIRDFISEVSEGEINFDDLLVSSLITHAPRKIVIHCSEQFKNKELLETIKNVFPGKVVICTGCDLCVYTGIKH